MNKRRALLCLWFAGLLLLAARPLIPSLYALGYGSDALCWNMYAATGRSVARAWLEDTDGARLSLDMRRYQWHRGFGDDANSHLDQSAAEAFAQFLAARPETRCRPWLSVRVEIRVWHGRDPVQVLRAVRSC